MQQKRRPEIQEFWAENNIYEKMTSQRDKANSFILHDGPPYLSSEKIHVGTALNKILKDILIKYKSQKDSMLLMFLDMTDTVCLLKTRL